MEMNLLDVVRFLTTNKYVLASKDKLNFSREFYQELERQREKEKVSEDTVTLYVQPVQPEGAFVVPQFSPSAAGGTPDIEVTPKSTLFWTDAFMQFIREAEVPKKCFDNRGEPYDTNKYSEDGMKAFRKAIESGISYEVLKNSTKLYYKSSSRFRKGIGNYMSQGDWRTDYEALKLSASTGEEKDLHDHIKQELDAGRAYTGDSWG